jgi:glycerate dehydrogenase/D-3-phosphoglycerate dehydrogenase
MKKRVLILNSTTQFSRKSEQSTNKLAERVDIHWHHVEGKDDGLEDILTQYPNPQIIVTSLVELDAVFLDKIPTLEAIIATSTATDYIDLKYCKDNEISVFNTPRYTGSSVAEHAFSLIMASTKHLRHADEKVRLGSADKPPCSMELEGKRLGIIGLGHIGSRVAHYGRCFGMDVCYYNRSSKTFSNAVQVNLETLLKTADVIVMTVPLNKESFHLIGKHELQLMKHSAFLINIGTDEVIEADCLVEALRNGEIAGAGLDIVSEYKTYLNTPNLIMTQSCGWFTTESVKRRTTGWITTLEHYLDGNPINKMVC